MLTFEIDVEDLIEGIERAASDLDSETERAMAFGGDLIAAEAKRKAPQGPSGLLEASIQRLPVLGSFLAGTLAADVVAAAPYALAVEEGTQPHVIEPRFRRALRFPGFGGFHFARRVQHPGTAAQPFMGPALESEADAVAEAVMAGLERALRKNGF